jgi:hypothetical protein
MAGYVIASQGSNYGASNSGQPAPTGLPALDAATIANLGLTAAEASAPVVTETLTTPQFVPLLPGQMGPPTVKTPAGPVKSDIGHVLQTWYTMNSDEVQAVQQQLWDAGLYPTSWYAKGQQPAWGDPWTDQQGFAAYRTLLRRASTTNTAVKDILTATSGQATQLANKGFQPVLTNPTDLAAAIKKGALDVLGVGVSDAEVADIIAKYQTAERQAQWNSIQVKAQGGDVVKAPDVTNFVTQQLTALHPDEASAAAFHTAADELMAGVKAGQKPV